MAHFNPNDYETVDQRIRRFYGDFPAGRITTDLVSAVGDPGRTRWVVKASVWRERVDGEPDGTGYAFENDGAGMANKTSALENCETSAIGRALAQIGYSGDKRATRDEMAKVAAQQPTRGPAKDYLALAQEAETAEAVQAIGAEARADGAPQAYIDQIAAVYRQKAAA